MNYSIKEILFMIIKELVNSDNKVLVKLCSKVENDVKEYKNILYDLYREATIFSSVKNLLGLSEADRTEVFLRLQKRLLNER